MLKSEVTILVDSDPGTTFAYVADFGRHHEWAAQRLALKQTTPGPVGLRTEFDSTGIQLRVKLHDKVTVTEYVANERLAYESRGDLGDYLHYFHFEKAGSGTRVTYGASFLGGPAYQRVLAHPIWPFVPKGLRGDLKGIKARLEDRTSSARS